MNRKITKFALAILSMGLLSGCTLSTLDVDFDFGGEPEEETEVEDSKLEITSYLDHLEVSINGLGQLGTDYRLVALPSYQYLGNESFLGLALPENVGIRPFEIAKVKGGEAQIISIPKYLENGMDASNLKYFVMSEKNVILEGPRFVSSFNEHIYNYETIEAINKKGITSGANYEEGISELGVSYVFQMLSIEDLIVPNEVVVYDELIEEDVVVDLKWEETTKPQDDVNGYIWIKAECPDDEIREEYVDKFVVNGKTYYFRMFKDEDDRSIAYEKSLQHYAEIFSQYSNPDLTKFPDAVRSKIIVDIMFNKQENSYKTPQFLYYPDCYSSSGACQICTNNKYGYGYAQAIFEYLAKYFMTPKDDSGKYPHGEVSRFVIGNEVDADTFANGITAKDAAKLSLEDYVEEHERSLRLANNSFKKYHKQIMACTSFSNYFSLNKGTHSTKNILSYICSKTRAEGNYDWGISLHAYGVGITNPNFIHSDYFDGRIKGDYSSSHITYTNLEVLDNYLHQQNKLVGKNPHKLFLTINGVSSVFDPDDPTTITEGQNMQCAGIAYAYMKACHLDSVEAFCYYNYKDSENTDNINYGLLDKDDEKKLSYELYKWIDTKYSEQISVNYLKEIEWVDPNTWISYGLKYGNISSWLDTMNVVGSDFDFQTVWDYQKLVANRTVSEIYAN